MNFDTLVDFYVQGYATVRNAEHIVDGNHEVMVVVHDAFQVRHDLADQANLVAFAQLGILLV